PGETGSPSTIPRHPPGADRTGDTPADPATPARTGTAHRRATPRPRTRRNGAETARPTPYPACPEGTADPRHEPGRPTSVVSPAWLAPARWPGRPTFAPPRRPTGRSGRPDRTATAARPPGPAGPA